MKIKRFNQINENTKNPQEVLRKEQYLKLFHDILTAHEERIQKWEADTEWSYVGELYDLNETLISLLEETPKYEELKERLNKINHTDDN